jgi:hypothetical protein
MVYNFHQASKLKITKGHIPALNDTEISPIVPISYNNDESTFAPKNAYLLRGDNDYAKWMINMGKIAIFQLLEVRNPA